MTIKKYLFWIVFTLAIISIIVYSTSTNLPKYDDSVTSYSIVKDSIGLLIAIIGLKLAADWKEQSTFSQKNQKAIHLMQTVIEFENVYIKYFNYHKKYLLEISDIFAIIPSDLDWNDQNNDELEKKYSEQYSFTLEKFTYHVNHINESMATLKMSMNSFISQAYDSFILKENNFITTVLNIKSVLSDYFFIFDSLSIVENTPYEKVTQHLVILSFHRSNRLSKTIYTKESLDEIEKNVLDNISILKSILQEFY